jgi:DNA-binding HxlR family transcriptional regulator
MYQELEGKNCLLYKNLDLLGKKWMIFILLEMSKDINNSFRYRDFEKILPELQVEQFQCGLMN